MLYLEDHQTSTPKTAEFMIVNDDETARDDMKAAENEIILANDAMDGSERKDLAT